MPRRNGNAKKLHRKSTAVARGYAPHTGIVRAGSPIALEDLVRPVGRCGRLLMFTQETVDQALRQAQAKYDREGSGNRPARWFACDRCPHCHLTTRVEWKD